jgi:hypothetical protein
MEITILLRQQLTTNIPDYTVKYGGDIYNSITTSRCQQGAAFVDILVPENQHISPLRDPFPGEGFL